MDDAGALMDRMYRHQRHVYDLSRKYYLAGRDEAIARLKPARGDTVLEIGCGTGRNLVKAAGAYPQARFFGLDVSREMLGAAALIRLRPVPQPISSAVSPGFGLRRAIASSRPAR